MKYIAVVFLCISQLAICFRLYLTYNSIDLFKNEIGIINRTLDVLYQFGKISLPLMLVWMISQIYSYKDNALRMVIFYGILSVIFYVTEILSINFIVIPRMNEILNELMGFTIPASYYKLGLAYVSNLNVFIDMFLCSLIYFFGFYTPKKIKTNTGLTIFRLCAFIPIIFIAVTFVIYGLTKMGYLDTSIYTFSLLPSKGLVSYFIFITILVYLYNREKIYKRLNPASLPYREYKTTNRYVINYSIVASIIFIIYAILDSVLGYIPNLSYFGIGDSWALMLAVPFLLIHDFTQKPIRRISVIFVGPIYAVTYLSLVVIYLGLVCEILKPIIEALEQTV